jgi:hypothetical protein
MGYISNKNCFAILFILLLFSSCSSWERIGTLTMVSTRNIESTIKYTELARSVEGISDETVRSIDGQGALRTEHKGRLDAAIDNAVAKVEGGEFLKNIQISVMGGRIKVVGDVWGYRAPGLITKEQQAKLDAEKEQQAKQAIQDKKDFEQERREAERKIAKEKKEAEKKLAEKKRDEDDVKLAASFKIGDQVRFKNNPFGNNLTKGTVIGKKDTWNATVKYTNDKGEEKTKNIPFKELSKVME